MRKLRSGIGAVKAASVLPTENPDGGDLIVTALVPYGGPFGGRDAQQEYFNDQTDFWLDRIPKRPIVYYHGGEEYTPEIIGEELGHQVTPEGVLFTVALKADNRFARRVWNAAKKGLARASSGAIAHLVRAEADGWLRVWPMAELSLFDERHAPVNPLSRVELAAAKAQFDRAGLRLKIRSKGRKAIAPDPDVTDDDLQLRAKALFVLGED